MKKLITLVGAAALALLTSSCMQQHTTLSLNKDGSGTISETTILGAQMMAMMGAAGEGQDPLAQMFKKAQASSADVAKKMGEGVTVKEVKKLDEGGKKGIVVIYAFEDINKIDYVFGQGLGGDETGEDKKDPLDITYKDGVLTINNKYEKPEGEVEKPEVDEQQMAMAMQMMQDLRISLTIEAPGGIAETNAQHVEGNKVTIMDMDMGKLADNPEKFKAFMSAQPDSPAEAKELLKGVDGVKIETSESLTIKLK